MRWQLGPSAWVAVALTAAGVLVPTGARAQARELQLVEDDLTRLGVVLRTVVEQTIDLRLPESKARFTERLTNAEILFLLGDHERASIVLYELVGEPKYASESMLPRALFYLAESLFHLRHDASARTYFNRLVAMRAPGHLREAVRRLIQIADRSGKWEGLEDDVAVLRAQGPLPPDIAYIHAKSLLRQGRSEAAKKAALEVPADHRLYAKAYFLAAIAEVQSGRYDAALELFAQLMTVADTYEDAATLRDLAAMNRARLYLEQGNVAEAIDSFQQVRRTGPHFDESLYEVTWSYVRAAHDATTDGARAHEYGKALRALEILLLSDGEAPLAPEARLLFGNILQRMGRYDEATASFGEVVRRYATVRDDLDALTNEVADPAQYYDEVVSRAQTGGGLLPSLALRWAANEDGLKDALRLVDELETSNGWLADSMAVANQLLAVLDSDKRTSFFPDLQETQVRALEVENSLTSASQRLLAIERELVRGQLSGEQRAELDALLAERAALEPEYRAMPQRSEDYRGRETGVRRRLVALEQEAFRLRYELQGLRAQVKALNDLLERDGDQLPKRAREEAEDRLDQEPAILQQLEQAQAALARELENEKVLLTQLTAGGTREDEVRRQYQATLEREQRLFSGLGQASGEGARIARLRELVARYYVEIGAFRSRLDAVVSERAQTVRAEVLREQGELVALERAAEAIRGDAKRVVGEVALASLDEVERKFRDIVLRADVGIVDVAWGLKELKTQEINRQVAQQRRELETLEREFSDVLKEP